MGEQVKKLTASYFSYLYKLTQKWKIVTERAQKPLSALKNQAEQLSHIEKVDINKEFSDFPDLKEKLLFKVYIGLDEELTDLKSLLNELNSAIQELRNKLVALEKSTENVDWDNKAAICGSALHPSLPDLMQMALTSWRIYNDMYQNVANSLKSVDVRIEKSLRQINFGLSEAESEKINKIVALTQYCYTDS